MGLCGDNWRGWWGPWKRGEGIEVVCDLQEHHPGDHEGMLEDRNFAQRVNWRAR